MPRRAETATEKAPIQGDQCDTVVEGIWSMINESSFITDGAETTG